jgi:ABC-type multidrug transport system ATPase subunit
MIKARGLVKRYGSATAVDNLSLDVLPGTVTGFLGRTALARPRRRVCCWV